MTSSAERSAAPLESTYVVIAWVLVIDGSTVTGKTRAGSCSQSASSVRASIVRPSTVVRSYRVAWVTACAPLSASTFESYA